MSSDKIPDGFQEWFDQRFTKSRDAAYVHHMAKLAWKYGAIAALSAQPVAVPDMSACFMTAESGGGEYKVVLRFQTLAKMQDAHSAMIHWLAAAPKPEQPATVPDGFLHEVWFSQFLTDVLTAAGLLAHGKRDKGLAERIGRNAFRCRAARSPKMSIPLTHRRNVSKKRQNVNMSGRPTIREFRRVRPSSRKRR